MATVEQVYEGMKIFMANCQNQADICAEHDMIYGPPHEMLLSVDELQRLEEAGWFVQDDYWVHHC